MTLLLLLLFETDAFCSNQYRYEKCVNEVIDCRMSGEDKEFCEYIYATANDDI